METKAAVSSSYSVMEMTAVRVQPSLGPQPFPASGLPPQPQTHAVVPLADRDGGMVEVPLSPLFSIAVTGSALASTSAAPAAPSRYQLQPPASAGRANSLPDKATLADEIAAAAAAEPATPPGATGNTAGATLATHVRRVSVTLAAHARRISEHVMPRSHLEKARVNTALADPPARYFKWARIHPLCYAMLAGIIGAQCVLFAKAVAEMVKATMENPKTQWDVFLPYCYLLAMVVCVLAQQHFLAAGLQLFDAMFIVPVYMVFFTLTAVIVGGLYYEEFKVRAGGRRRRDGFVEGWW
jgi:hypothetical protein